MEPIIVAAGLTFATMVLLFATIYVRGLRPFRWLALLVAVGLMSLLLLLVAGPVALTLMRIG